MSDVNSQPPSVSSASARKPGVALYEDAKYTRVAMLLHWAVALSMLGNVAIGQTIALLSDATLEKIDVRFWIDLHKSIGITVLGLAILRILWRATHRPPALSQVFASWERTAAHLVHWLLYVVIFALPLSGWAHDSAWVAASTHPLVLFGSVPFPRMGFLMTMNDASKDYWHDVLGNVHAYCAYSLYVLLALHIGGALKHQWVDRHPVLGRMLP
ncbi:cytochrome B [Pandoraea bronchicola]|uniref:Cytochrome B n=1 Tax=Pandoraea bronchicola TaxID=2508287 RepID=A0A5E5BMK1_9BURK|nr:cytochrome B [Pandoraea bronchicola]